MATLDELKRRRREGSVAPVAVAPTDPGAEVAALHDAWCAADDPRDPKWAQAWAEAAIRAGLPCYPDGRNDAGADGWRLWLAEVEKVNDG